MAALDTLAETLGRMAAILAAAILALVTGHILLEIVLRNVFGASTYVLDEVVGYGVGAMTFLALAHTFRAGEMIRVHLVLASLGRRARRTAEMLCASATLAAFLLVAIYFGRSALRNWREGSVSSSVAEIPLWIPDSVLLIGLAIFCLQLATYIARLAAGAPAILGPNVATE